MNQVEVIVTRCSDCCFGEIDYENNNKATCYAPVEVHKEHYNISKYYGTSKIPDFCPLLKNILTITLKQ